ncbi:hypothetical protein N7457_001680 [Penicillium paradoxum]|uniref:uncharacterized protein n=1 Tax=Penicillium paradoxum TaxID=176176 RepID=UPI0025483F9A|nr:uncharacterized protein N7457_001680 [Penicillium paradoxum]KAJ5795081.1 hypothetical protein N7457_001680 [Penicillium paradoxum]
MSTGSKDDMVLDAIWERSAPASDHNPTFQRIVDAVESQPEEERYRRQLQVGEYLLKLRSENAEAISLWYDYVLQSGVWKAERDDATFCREWGAVQKVHDKHQQNLAYITSIFQKAVSKWGDMEARSLFEFVPTKSTAEQVSKLLARGMSFEEVKRGLNYELVRRLGAVGRGHRKAKHLIQGDFVKAASSSSAGSLSSSQFKRHGLTMNPCGLLVEKQGPPSPDIRACEWDSENEIDNGESSEGVSGPAPEFLEASGDIDGQRNRDPDFPEESLNPGESPPTPPPTTAKSGHRRRGQSGSAHDRYRQSQSLTCPPSRLQKTCSCALSKSLIQKFSSAAPSDRARLIILRKVMRALGTLSAEKLCFAHTKALSAYLGMYTRQFTHSDMLSRLAYAAGQIGDWDGFIKLKSAWFTPSIFPGGVARSSFRFEVGAPVPRVARFSELGLDLVDVWSRIYGTDGTETRDSIAQTKAEEFAATGNVILPKLFGWLEDDISEISGVSALSRELGRPVSSMMQLIHLEFDMYDYHYTPAISRPRMGWNRNMFQSLTQQLIRQDVSYYAAYVAVRPDHAWRLMSFPYYTKSAYPGEDTGFTHIDLNIGDYLATGRGGNAVQGSVSFTDEDRDNCTIILPKMHLYLREWWSKISSHPDAQTSGHTITIYPWMWGKADEDRFGTKFIGAVCQTGDVRLTLPVIPHGSTGPTTRLRRTMMPWFGVIHEDHERVETAEAGTWSDVADAHRDMRLAARKPSGESSQKRSVSPYTFPGVTHLTGLGALSDAMLGRIRYSEWSVVAELDQLFGEDKVAAHAWILQWRRRAVRQFVEAFQRIISAEKLAYGERSFFHLLREGLAVPEPHLHYQKDLGVNDEMGDDMED